MSGSDVRYDIAQILEEMRSEHEQLFQMVEKIRAAIDAGDVSAAKHHLMQLQAYQQSHFEHEAELMKRYEYPHTDDHQKRHDALIGTLHDINKLIHLEHLRRLSRELANYLEDSLKHVIEVDRPFQDFLSVAGGRDG